MPSHCGHGEIIFVVSQRNNQSPNLLGGLTGLTYLIALLVLGGLLLLAFGEDMSGCGKRTGPVMVWPQDLPSRSSSLVDSAGIHISTGLVYAPGIDAIQRQCMGCHSPKIIAQARATREGWIQLIRWMQETQGLWDLSTDESAVLDYLSTHYAPEEHGRRANLDVEAIQWYHLSK